MATKSISKTIRIKDKPLARSFVRALENAENYRTERIISKAKVIDVKGDNIKKFFGAKG